jgi:hypothetical protein
MNNLSELRDLFLKHGKKIKDFQGWFLKVGKDTFTMLDGEIYKNKIKLSKKEVMAMFKKKGK